MTTEPTPSSTPLSLRGLLLGSVLCSALLACAAGQPRIASDLEADVPANLRGDYKSFVENCGKCHSLDRPLTAHVDDVSHWDLYVAKMMRTAGSAISARESPKILRFLYWYTERKQRLAAEGKAAKHTAVQQEAPAAAPVPASAAPAPNSAPVPETNIIPVQEPAQGKQGESVP